MSKRKTPVDKLGFLGYLSSAEEVTLRAVSGGLSEDARRTLADSKIPNESDDTCLLRFCRARKFVQAAAAEMVQTHVAWYISYGVPKLLRMSESSVLGGCDPATIRALYPRGFHGHDKLGRPICIQRPGLMNAPALLKLVSLEDYLRYEVWQQERGLRLMAKRAAACGHHVESVGAVIDLKGLGMKHFSKDTYSVLKAISALCSDHYPETLGKMCIINAPYFFQIAWNMIRRWLDERTKHKISIIGTNYRKHLLSWIDADQLPKEWGGACRCGVESGRSSCFDGMCDWLAEPEEGRAEGKAAADAGGRGMDNVGNGDGRVGEGGGGESSDDGDSKGGGGDGGVEAERSGSGCSAGGEWKSERMSTRQPQAQRRERKELKEFTRLPSPKTGRRKKEECGEAFRPRTAVPCSTSSDTNLTRRDNETACLARRLDKGKLAATKGNPGAAQCNPRNVRTEVAAGGCFRATVGGLKASRNEYALPSKHGRQARRTRSVDRLLKTTQPLQLSSRAPHKAAGEKGGEGVGGSVPPLLAKNSSAIKLWGTQTSEHPLSHPLSSSASYDSEYLHKYGEQNVNTDSMAFGEHVCPTVEYRGNGRNPFEDPCLVRECIDVRSGKTHAINIEVNAGSRVSWEFQTARYEIGFECTFHSEVEEDDSAIEGGDQMNAMEQWRVPQWEYRRCEKKDGPVLGVFVAPCAGICMLQWDNSFSYFKDKELSFNVWCSQFAQEGRSGGVQFFPEGRGGVGGRRTGVAGAILHAATRSGRRKTAISAPGDEDSTRCSLQ